VVAVVLKFVNVLITQHAAAGKPFAIVPKKFSAFALAAEMPPATAPKKLLVLAAAAEKVFATVSKKPGSKQKISAKQ
jgi:hypothetical protein